MVWINPIEFIEGTNPILSAAFDNLFVYISKPMQFILLVMLLHTSDSMPDNNTSKQKMV